MKIVAIKKPGTVQMSVVFKTEPVLTEEVFKQFLNEIVGHPHTGKAWQREGELLKGDFSEVGIPDQHIIATINSALAYAERTIERKQNQVADDLADYLDGLKSNTGLPLED